MLFHVQKLFLGMLASPSRQLIFEEEILASTFLFAIL